MFFALQQREKTFENFIFHFYWLEFVLYVWFSRVFSIILNMNIADIPISEENPLTPDRVKEYIEYGQLFTKVHSSSGRQGQYYKVFRDIVDRNETILKQYFACALCHEVFHVVVSDGTNKLLRHMKNHESNFNDIFKRNAKKWKCIYFGFFLNIFQLQKNANWWMFKIVVDVQKDRCLMIVSLFVLCFESMFIRMFICMFICSIKCSRRRCFWTSKW